jgi:DNA repair exonuclease SbcCD ATPase subunit
MTKEELKQEAEEWVKKEYPTLEINAVAERYCKAYLAGAEPREKRISELEEKISVLLSCKNCPENKGGFICVKEYENKCLAQKIQYIEELQEENKVLAQNLEDTEILNKTYEKKNNDLKKENAELKARLNAINLLTPELKKMSKLKRQQLTTAKELISEFVEWANWQGNSKCPSFKSIQDKAEQFLNSEVENDSKEV